PVGKHSKRTVGAGNRSRGKKSEFHSCWSVCAIAQPGHRPARGTSSSEPAKSHSRRDLGWTFRGCCTFTCRNGLSRWHGWNAQIAGHPSGGYHVLGCYRVDRGLGPTTRGSSQSKSASSTRPAKIDERANAIAANRSNCTARSSTLVMRVLFLDCYFHPFPSKDCIGKALPT